MTQIAGMLPTIAKIARPVMGGLGVVSNIIRQKRLDEVQKAALQKQKDLSNLINNPALLAQKVQAMEQPLNQGLVQGVENQAQAGLAERGLGTSPQIANEVFAQALGPYEQQNRTEALKAVLQMYGMDESMINTIIGAEGKPTDTTGFWQQLQGKPNIPTLPSATPNYPPSPDQGGMTFPSSGSSGGEGSIFGLPGDVPFEGTQFPGSEGLF